MTKSKLLVHLHLYYHDQLDYMLDCLKNINNCEWDLYVTLCERNEQLENKILEFKPDTCIYSVENRGYDIWPFIQVLRKVNLNDYDFVLKLHTKQYIKNVTTLNDVTFKGYQWRDSLLYALLGTKEIFQKNIDILASSEKFGMIADKNFFVPLLNLPEDTTMLSTLKKQLNINNSYSKFLAGTMFLIRSDILKVLRNSDIKKKDFPLYSKSYSVATLAHVIERIFSILVVENRKEIYLSTGLKLKKQVLFSKEVDDYGVKKIKKYRILDFIFLTKEIFLEKVKIKLFGIKISYKRNNKNKLQSYIYTNQNILLNNKKKYNMAIFASYSKDGKIADYVVYYLKELKKVCDGIIFVADNPIYPKEIDKIKDYVIFAKFERHEEYDFGSYKRGYIYAKSMRLLDKCQQLIICNDSCFGPVFPFRDLFDKMKDKKCDFWGVSNHEVAYHIQSYFMVFKNNVINSSLFDDFMKSIKKENSVWEVIKKYEIGLSQFLLKNGYKSATCIPDYLEEMKSFSEKTGIYNKTYFPLLLLNKYKFPLLKVKIFSQDPEYIKYCNNKYQEVLEFLKKENCSLYKSVKLWIKGKNKMTNCVFQKQKIQKDGKIIKKYKFCGITLLRKEKSLTKNKWNLLGIKFCKKIKIHKNEKSIDVKFTEFYLIKKIKNKINFPKVENPLVSIVIPVYNQYKYTNLCLQSILKNTHNIDYEIIIADDNSTDETKNICNNVSNVIISRNEQNLRFLKNCNKAAKLAKGKYIVFLNNDTQVQKGWLSSLIDTIEKDENIGMVGSKLIYPDGTLQEAGGIIFADASGCNYGRGDNSDEIKYNYEKEVDYISGASIMLKRELWEELGGFDETFAPAYYEDTDLAFQIRYNKKLKVVYVPKSVVVHFEGKSNGTDISSGQKKYQNVNRQKFYQKWEEKLHKYHVNSFAGTFLSRERAQNKKNILVIDWGFLTFDKDTGSRTTWQYMQFFKQKGFNVKLYPHLKKNDNGYLEKIVGFGFDVILEDFSSYIKHYGKYFDYIYLNRPDIANQYIDLLRKYTKAKIIYQCHDLHYLRQYRDRLLLKVDDAEEKLIQEKSFEYDLFKKMDVVCSFSFDEVNVIKKEDEYVNAIQIPLYILNVDKMEQYHYNAKERKDIMFVAGFSHRPNVDAAVWFVNDIWPLIKKQNKDVKLYLVGSNPTQEVLNLKSDDVIVTGFVTDEELDDYYSKIKLVVVPLRSGAGVKGKIIESLFHKVPVITTDIGVEGIDNKDDVIAVYNEPKEFAKYTVSCYSNNELLNKQSIKYQSYIQKYFSENAVCHAFENYIDFSNNKGE